MCVSEGGGPHSQAWCLRPQRGCGQLSHTLLSTRPPARLHTSAWLPHLDKGESSRLTGRHSQLCFHTRKRGRKNNGLTSCSDSTSASLHPGVETSSKGQRRLKANVWEESGQILSAHRKCDSMCAPPQDLTSACFCRASQREQV